MKNELHVDDPALAKALTAQVGSDFLSPYFDQARSVREACDYLDQPMGKVHYWTRRWHDLGALEIVERVPRKGRAIARYRCVAREFVITHELLPETLLAQQLQRTNQRLLDGLLTSVPQMAYEGRLTIHQPPGQRSVTHDRTTLDGSNESSSLSSSFQLLLTEQEARQLRAELNAVRDRWLERAGGRDRRLRHQGYTLSLTVLATTPLDR
ncbi:hypothetical protein [Enemella sp. A6]|uniref:hypothetical protein n=1 Tax=Enemella sp. A6 TaxID=3440152 RepID=UPI003EBD4E4D